MKAAVIVFPGPLRTDCSTRLKTSSSPVRICLAKDGLPKVDWWSSGRFQLWDYLRTERSRVFLRDGIRDPAREAGPARDRDCNGFRSFWRPALCRARCFRNKTLEFICKHTGSHGKRTDDLHRQMTPGETLCVPIAHGEGIKLGDEVR